MWNRKNSGINWCPRRTYKAASNCNQCLELLFLETLGFRGTTGITHYLLFNTFSSNTVIELAPFFKVYSFWGHTRMKYTLLVHQKVCLNFYSSQRPIPQLRSCFNTSKLDGVAGVRVGRSLLYMLNYEWDTIPWVLLNHNEFYL